MPESIRWLLLTGRKEAAKKEIQRAARINKVYIPDAVLLAEIEASRTKTEQKGTVLDLFKHWSLAKTTLILFFTWMAVNLSYYGLAQNAGDLPGNTYLVFELLALSEVPGFFFVIPMMEKFGRVPCLVLYFGVGGAACILCGILPKSKTKKVDNWDPTDRLQILNSPKDLRIISYIL